MMVRFWSGHILKLSQVVDSKPPLGCIWEATVQSLSEEYVTDCGECEVERDYYAYMHSHGQTIMQRRLEEGMEMEWKGKMEVKTGTPEILSR